MSDDHSKMEMESRTAEAMIEIFCHGQHDTKEEVYVPSAGSFGTTLCNALKNAHFRRTSQSAPNVLYIAINRT
jgi:hypothetical protein